MSKKNTNGPRKPGNRGSWKPGQSGNPAGSKKGSKKDCKQPIGASLPECFALALAEKITITQDGKPQSVDMGTAIAKKVLHSMLSAQSPLEQRHCVDILVKLGVIGMQEQLIEAANDEPEQVSPFSESDRQLLQIVQEAQEDAERDDPDTCPTCGWIGECDDPNCGAAAPFEPMDGDDDETPYPGLGDDDGDVAPETDPPSG